MGTVRSVNIGEKNGGAKRPVGRALLRRDWGVEGDGHAGPGEKQVSLLAWESSLRMRAAGADVTYGSFGENITVSGIAPASLRVGDRLRVGPDALLEVTRVGKECPRPCEIFRQAGYCIMPEEGIFCRVVRGGMVAEGDPVEPVGKEDRTMRVGVIVVSDSAASGARRDGCVRALSGVLPPGETVIAETVIVPDDIPAIRSAVTRLIDERGLDLVVTSGGTGLGPRDVTPEALDTLIEKRIPGIEEEMRRRGAAETPTAVLSRSVAGTRGRSILIALPGSPRGAAESLEAVWAAIPHALDILRGKAGECARKRRGGKAGN